MNESSKKLGEVCEKANSEIKKIQKLIAIAVNLDDSQDETVDNITARKNVSNTSKFSKMMKETLVFLLKSQNSPRIEQDTIGQASINRVPIQIMGVNSLKIQDKIMI